MSGVAAVLRGTPVSTHALDVVYLPDADKAEQLTSRLASGLLPVNALSNVGSGLGYAELLAHSSDVEVAPDLTVRVLSLPMLIALAEEEVCDITVYRLMHMRHALEEQRRLDALSGQAERKD